MGLVLCLFGFSGIFYGVGDPLAADVLVSAALMDNRDCSFFGFVFPRFRVIESFGSLWCVDGDGADCWVSHASILPSA